MKYPTNMNVPNIQRLAQGSNGNRNALVRNIRACKSGVQPGNCFRQQVRPQFPPVGNDIPPP